jgi:hypothetical protein
MYQQQSPTPNPKLLEGFGMGGGENVSYSELETKIFIFGGQKED